MKRPKKVEQIDSLGDVEAVCQGVIGIKVSSIEMLQVKVLAKCLLYICKVLRRCVTRP